MSRVSNAGHANEASRQQERSSIRGTMQLLKQLMIAIAVLAAFAAPVSAKTVADETWEQINQTMPHRPSNDEFQEALP